MFKVRYSERRMSKINTIETKPKQSQFSQFVEKIQPNVQSLTTMGKDRSFGNVFWSYNFRVFDKMKFVTFCKS